MQAATVGRVVHLVMNDGKVRPMHVTAAFDVTSQPGFPGPEDVESQLVNGVIMLDGANDSRPVNDVQATNYPVGIDVESPSIAHGYSRPYSINKLPGSWHWPERV